MQRIGLSKIPNHRNCLTREQVHNLLVCLYPTSQGAIEVCAAIHCERQIRRQGIGVCLHSLVPIFQVRVIFKITCGDPLLSTRARTSLIRSLKVVNATSCRGVNRSP